MAPPSVVNVDTGEPDIVAQVFLPVGVVPPSDMWFLDGALRDNLQSRYVIYASTVPSAAHLEVLRYLRPHYQRALATGEGERVRFLAALDEYMKEVWGPLSAREIKVCVLQ